VTSSFEIHRATSVPKVSVEPAVDDRGGAEEPERADDLAFLGSSRRLVLGGDRRRVLSMSPDGHERHREAGNRAQEHAAHRLTSLTRAAPTSSQFSAF
jgi:hypothetical protein